MLKRFVVTVASFSFFACSTAAPREDAPFVRTPEPTDPAATTETSATHATPAPASPPATAEPAPAPSPDPNAAKRERFIASVNEGIDHGAPGESSAFTSWAYHHAGITELPIPIGSQACDPFIGGVFFAVNGGNIDGVESALRAGDLLYSRAEEGARVAYVMTWMGLRWNDLVGDAFDRAHIGEPGSRFSADVYTHGISADDMPVVNPWMVVESTDSGAGYRPFAGPQRGSLSHVRRFIGTTEGASDPLSSLEFRFQGVVGVPSRYVAAPATGGFFEADTSAHTCESR